MRVRIFNEGNPRPLPANNPTNELYERLGNCGLEYGPRFRGVREFYLGEHEALAKVQLTQGLAKEKYVMHPALLDACLHAYPLILDGANEERPIATVRIYLFRWRAFAATKMGSIRRGRIFGYGVSRRTTRRWSTYEFTTTPSSR